MNFLGFRPNAFIISKKFVLHFLSYLKMKLPYGYGSEQFCFSPHTSAKTTIRISYTFPMLQSILFDSNNWQAPTNCFL
jgi:hypothetical protein